MTAGGQPEDYGADGFAAISLCAGKSASLMRVAVAAGNRVMNSRWCSASPISSRAFSSTEAPVRTIAATVALKHSRTLASISQCAEVAHTATRKSPSLRERGDGNLSCHTLPRERLVGVGENFASSEF
jgi:hypothetical protein